MYKKDVINHFNGAQAIAKALEISKQAISGWGDVIPRGAAYEIESITDGELKVDRAVYRKIKEDRRLIHA
jgi:hypothetical protein